MHRSLLLGARRQFGLTRLFGTVAKLRIVGVQLKQEESNDSQSLCIDFNKDVVDGSHQMHLPLVWLRDHSRDPSSYNFATNQRKLDMTDIFERCRLADTKDALSYDARGLQVRWQDGVNSVFKPEDLIAWSTPPKECRTSEVLELWDRSTLQQVPEIPLWKLTLEEFVVAFVRYGVVSVTHVDYEDPQRTRLLCERIAPIHNTFYGDFWVFGTQNDGQKAEHEDTAYGNEGIAVHTDGTYFEQTPGIQVFHCLHPAQEGGDTVLADGFAVADKLKKHNQKYYHLLTSTPVEHHYIEGGEIPSKAKIFTRSTDRPVIALDRMGNPKQIRFNPYDRAPVAMSTMQNIVDFYEAYECFSQIAHDPSNELRVALKPGTVIFIDNHRVFHGRTAFKGSRKMCGCYLSRDNFFAVTRHLLPEEYQKCIQQ